jgi:RNA polymerase sigma-70 factor (ECF subfamily)
MRTCMSLTGRSADEPLRIRSLPWSVDIDGSRRAEQDATKIVDYDVAADDRLVEALESRDQKALETLYDRYGDYVYSVCLRMVGDVQLAEDLTQEVFLRLWRRPDLYDIERGRFVTWLLSVARNRAIDERRSRGRRFKHESPPSLAAEESLATASVEGKDTAVLSEERVFVQRALAKLPPEQQLAIRLAYFGGYTQQEIALGLNQPLGTVKTRIRLGMQKLRLLLIDQGEDGLGTR